MLDWITDIWSYFVKQPTHLGWYDCVTSVGLHGFLPITTYSIQNIMGSYPKVNKYIIKQNNKGSTMDGQLD